MDRESIHLSVELIDLVSVGLIHDFLIRRHAMLTQIGSLERQNVWWWKHDGNGDFLVKSAYEAHAKRVVEE
jgi:hypothetical protein